MLRSSSAILQLAVHRPALATLDQDADQFDLTTAPLAGTKV
jgi:hypothetical protein